MYIKPQDFWGCDPSLLQDKEIKKKQAQIEEEQAKAPRGLLKSSRLKERQKGSSWNTENGRETELCWTSWSCGRLYYRALKSVINSI